MSPAAGDGLAGRVGACARTVAEAILLSLAAHGVEFIFLNPGTDTAPLQEAMAALAARGVAAPRAVLCNHESTALAAAHGYWTATGRPQCVMVHVDVGTQNLGAMLHNVFRDQAGVVIFAGRAPYDASGRLPGARSSPIHWRQDVPDQFAAVRGYAKWAVELARPETAARAVGRAVQVAGASPAGAAYLTAARELLMQPWEPSWGEDRCYRPPRPAGIGPATLADVCDRLATAACPVLVTSARAAGPGAARELVALAQLLGLPVVGMPEACVLPWPEPLWAGDPLRAADELAAADLAFVVDADVPWIPGQMDVSPSATVIHLDPDPVHAGMPLWSFPADLPVACDTATGLAQIGEALARRGRDDPAAGARWQARRERLARGSRPPAAAPAGGHDAAAADGHDAAAAGRRCTVAGVCSALRAELSETDIVLEEAVTNGPAVQSGLAPRRPGTFIRTRGGGLGWALGAALGFSLAGGPGRTVAVVGDGGFLFGVPTSALQAAAEAGAPFLTVVLDNGGYYAAERPVRELYPGGVSAGKDAVVGTRWTKPPDIALLARACHAFGVTVRSAAGLSAGLRAAVAAVDGGQAAVVHVILDPPSSVPAAP
jgi:acetolactate synthase-1/2/3 large subunit